jgi:hypothetical protein
MLILVTMVGFILFRPGSAPAQVPDNILAMKTSSPGWEVRYNAAYALARRGSTKLPCGVLVEMLDENQQKRNFVTKTQDGTEYVDELGARSAVLVALKAMDAWLDHKDAVKAVSTSNAAELQNIYAAIDKLAKSNDKIIRDKAETVKKKTS